MKELGQSFKYNGFNYQRTDTDVLFFLKNNYGQYIGLETVRGTTTGAYTTIEISKVVFTGKKDAFIFNIDKEIFEKDGIKHAVRMLREETGNGAKKNFAGFKPEMI